VPCGDTPWITTSQHTFSNMKGKIIKINALYVNWRLKKAMKKSAENITQHHMSSSNIAQTHIKYV
jgi:hypothetical protein